MHQRLKTIVMGGSNTVVVRGYLDTVIYACQQEGIIIDIVADHSVGNTTIGYGLMLLKREESLSTCQLLIIEYAINDDFAYNINESYLVYWCRLYEGVIRYARTVNPALKILTVVLDTRNGEWTRRVPQIASRITYMSAVYDTWYCDVNREILNRYGLAVINDPHFYAEGDSAHYRSPIATSIVGNIIASRLIRSLTAERQECHLLPPVIDNGQCSDATLIRTTEIAQKLRREKVLYQNWKFSSRPVNLADQTLNLTLTGGVVLGIEYVCEPTTAPLFIGIQGQSIAVGTMKFGVQDGTYKFLISYLPTEFLFEYLPQLKDDTIYTVSFAAQGNHQHEYTPRDGAPFKKIDATENGVCFPIGDILLSRGGAISIAEAPAG